MLKNITVEDIFVEVTPTCPLCKYVNKKSLTKTNLADILYSGLPICEECGEELIIPGKVIITQKKK